MEKFNTTEEIYSLPSLGKIYPQEVTPEIKIRSMTTAEEMRRLSQTDYPYRLMSDIMKDCLLEDIGIHPYDLCLGDYLFLLHRLRAATYGEEYSLTTVCPYCGHKNEETINLIDIPKNEFDPSVLDYLTFVLPKSKQTVDITYQTPRMLDTISHLVKNHKKKSKDKETDPTILYTIACAVRTIDGKEQDIDSVVTWVRKLPMLDTQTIMAHINKVNNQIGLDLSLEETCEICTLSYETSFRTTAEFFRPNLDI